MGDIYIDKKLVAGFLLKVKVMTSSCFLQKLAWIFKGKNSAEKQPLRHFDLNKNKNKNKNIYLSSLGMYKHQMGKQARYNIFDFLTRW